MCVPTLVVNGAENHHCVHTVFNPTYIQKVIEFELGQVS